MVPKSRRKGGERRAKGPRPERLESQFLGHPRAHLGSSACRLRNLWLRRRSVSMGLDLRGRRRIPQRSRFALLSFVAGASSGSSWLWAILHRGPQAPTGAREGTTLAARCGFFARLEEAVRIDPSPSRSNLLNSWCALLLRLPSTQLTSVKDGREDTLRPGHK
jgi:hypothetical protein